MWKIEEKEERMTAPISFPPVDTATLAELRRRYEDTPEVESRTCYQMILLAQQDYKVPQIARIGLAGATAASTSTRARSGRS
jgi:hypothetical protein